MNTSWPCSKIWAAISQRRRRDGPDRPPPGLLLTLPKGTIHVISDVHGEDKKLRHVINNASGTLRPLVEKLFKDKLQPAQFQEFLKFLFYPAAEMAEQLEQTLTAPAQATEFAQRTLRDLFILVRHLASRYSLARVMSVFPMEY